MTTETLVVRGGFFCRRRREATEETSSGLREDSGDAVRTDTVFILGGFWSFFWRWRQEKTEDETREDVRSVVGFDPSTTGDDETIWRRRRLDRDSRRHCCCVLIGCGFRLVVVSIGGCFDRRRRRWNDENHDGRSVVESRSWVSIYRRTTSFSLTEKTKRDERMKWGEKKRKTEKKIEKKNTFASCADTCL